MIGNPSPHSQAHVRTMLGEWPLRSGASHVINTGRWSATRAWARAFVTGWLDIEGLRHTASLTGGTCITLFTPTASALPARPGHTFLLTDPAHRDWMLVAADTIGYDLVQ
jgi:hypothetical protein